MTIIYVLIPIALLLGFGFLVAFMISSLSGQYDDLDTPAYRMLIDDEPGRERPGERMSGRGLHPAPLSAGDPPRRKRRGFPLLDEPGRERPVVSKERNSHVFR